MQRLSAKMAPNEFLSWEREQPTRHHYVRGDIFDMAGGSARHNRLSVRLSSALDRAVEKGPCGVYSSDQKVGLADDVFVYPDVTVVCPPLRFRPGTKDVMTNPVLVVEVLSKNTEAYDRGDKLRDYLALTSITHVLLVSQNAMHIDVYRRAENGSITYETFGGGASLTLTHPTVTLSVDAVYAGVFDLPGDE
jgi:Uma2 family endonuclease